MRVLVTGATGFVGRWLVGELTAHGHEPIAAPSSSRLDVTHGAQVAALVHDVEPDRIIHLAAIAYGPDARRDPARALAVNADGTRNVVEAAATGGRGPIPVLTVSSSEVYGQPEAHDLPLREDAPLRTDQPYGLSKIAAEHAAREAATAGGVPLVVVRPFNHTGPGQRSSFVVPALATRVLEAAGRGDTSIPTGNLDVRRDFCDVRDVVRAYRLLLESIGSSGASDMSVTYNVASGRSVAIHEILERIARLAGAAIEPRLDPDLVRSTDPPDIRGDASALDTAVGWRPSIALETTLADVLEDVRRRLADDA